MKLRNKVDRNAAAVSNTPPRQVPYLISPDAWPSYQEWLVDAIIGRKTSRGKVYYLVKWTGWHQWDSWEPEEHLEGCQELVAEYNESRKKSLVAKRTAVGNIKKGKKKARKATTRRKRSTK